MGNAPCLGNIKMTLLAFGPSSIILFLKYYPWMNMRGNPPEETQTKITEEKNGRMGIPAWRSCISADPGPSDISYPRDVSC